MVAREILKIVPRLGHAALIGLAGLCATPALAQTQDAQQKATVCVACHVTGTVQSSSPIPIVWGQNEGYIYLQLRDFKNGVRATPQDATMNALAAAMSDADMHAMAARGELARDALDVGVDLVLPLLPRVRGHMGNREPL